MQAELKSAWGSDLEVVNNARVSFDKESTVEWRCKCGEKEPYVGNCNNTCRFTTTLRNEDIRLIGYLARGCTKNDWDEMISELTVTGEKDQIIETVTKIKRMPEHWAPFANGIGMKFRIKAPIPIMRQVFKTKIGTVESEVSRRYVDDEPEVYIPSEWRGRSSDKKQGSSDEAITEIYTFGWRPHPPNPINEVYMDAVNYAIGTYQGMIASGVCPEQARFVLPQGVYTEAIISNSLYGWARFYNQRSDRQHAQKEIADLADQIGEVAAKKFPHSWVALTGTV